MLPDNKYPRLSGICNAAPNINEFTIQNFIIDLLNHANRLQNNGSKPISLPR
jgi:hypothetical protein